MAKKNGGDCRQFLSKNVQMWDHFFPLLFHKDSKSLKMLDIRLCKGGQKRPFDVLKINSHRCNPNVFACLLRGIGQFPIRRILPQWENCKASFFLWVSSPPIHYMAVTGFLSWLSLKRAVIGTVGSGCCSVLLVGLWGDSSQLEYLYTPICYTKISIKMQVFVKSYFRIHFSLQIYTYDVLQFNWELYYFIINLKLVSFV